MLQSLPPFDFVQVLGIIATSLWVWSVSLKSDRRLNKIWMISNSIWVVHWILLGGWVGASNNFVNVVRSGLYLIKDWRETRYRWWMMWGLMAAYTLLSVPFFKEWSDVLPLLASYTTCIAFFFYAGGLAGRIIMVCGNFGWLGYGIIHGSYGGVISAIAVITISLTTIYRLYIDGKKSES